MNCSEVVVGNHKLHLFEINFDHSAQWILHFILSVLVCWKVKRQALRLYYLCLKFKFYCCVFSLLSQGCKTVEFEPIGIPLRWHEKKLFSACASSLYDIERSEKKDSRLRLFIARLLFLDSKNWIEIIFVYVYILPKQWCFFTLITINSTNERKNEWKWIRRIFYVPKLWLKLGHITFEKIWSIIC